MTKKDVCCLACTMSEPMTELAAIDAVRQQDADEPGLLGYHHCPVSDGYHLCLVEGPRTRSES
jgi:hypothetical protein